MNETYSAIVKKLDHQRLTVDINEEINIERLQTMYYDYDGQREVEIRFVDPRRFTQEQRRFIYALIGDISDFTGQPSESLKEVFKWRYEAITGRIISLSDISASTVSDATLYADIILDFIFENHIPFKKGYEILPFNQEYYFYKCIVTRTCCSCGKLHADIHHIEAVGMGNNRRKIDNTNRHFMALCRTCHTIIHVEGYTEFTSKRKLRAIKLDTTTLKRLGLNVKSE